MIKYIKYKNINTEAWDKCIRNAINKDVTALSGYLDIAYNKWDAIVLDNYKTVMPLPNNKKFISNNYYTNYLSPQLGIYSTKIEKQTISDFISFYKRKSHKSDYNLNKYNYLTDYNLDTKKAYEFDVYIKNIEILNTKFQIETRISNNEIIKFIESDRNISNIENSKINLDLFRKILAYTIRNSIAYTYIAYNKQNDIIGFMFLIKSFTKDKLIYSAIKEKSEIKEVFLFMLNNHLKNCRNNISIDLGFSNTYFDKIYKSLNTKSYKILNINKF